MSQWQTVFAFHRLSLFSATPGVLTLRRFVGAKVPIRLPFKHSLGQEQAAEQKPLSVQRAGSATPGDECINIIMSDFWSVSRNPPDSARINSNSLNKPNMFLLSHHEAPGVTLLRWLPE